MMCVRIAPLLALLLWGGGAGAQAPPGPECALSTVRLARIWGKHHVEEATLRLSSCDARQTASALEALSVLARPHGVDRPPEEVLAAFRADPERVAPDIARLHPGLLTRLGAVAERFPGRRIDIVSGHRPRARRTSRHRHARALDILVEGVSRAHLTELLRSLPGTGVGYYPNSTFTHVDVREQSAYWVDHSGPGEPAAYGPAEVPAEALERERREVVAAAMDALAPLAGAEEPARAGVAGEPARADDAGEREPPLTPEEVAALRRQVMAAIDRLGAD